jgi:hypothetical protein
MAAITGVVVLALLVGLFFLFRAMGSMGQQPSARERLKHNAADRQSGEHRAAGLD